MRKIRDYLGAGDVLRRLTAEAQRLAELDRAYRRAVPRPLAQASGVDHVAGDTLYLWADGGVVAAKLRQLAPMVRARLGSLAPECSAVRVVVRIGARETSRTRRPLPRIGERGAEALQELADALPASPLGTALARFAAHAANRSENGE